MRNNLPSLAMAALAGVSVVGASTIAAAQSATVAQSRPQRTARTTGAAADSRFRLPEERTPQAQGRGAAGGAEQIVRSAGAAIAQHRSIAARVRFQVDLFGQSLVGKGLYFQQGAGEERQFRMELETVASQQIHVCDGRYLWHYQLLPTRPGAKEPEQPTITRIDVAKVRQAMAQRPRGVDFRSGASAMVLGGLPQLVDALPRSFNFMRVEAGRLESLPMWIAGGMWQPESPADAPKGVARQAARGRGVDWKKLPPQMPEEALVYLGQDDLFPYRVEFRRRVPAADGAGEGPGEMLPVTTVEFFDVRLNSAIDPQQFVYQPGSVEVVDGTASFLRSLGEKDAADDGT